ncbi:MAG: hypothetical protein ACERKX_05400 [Anaerolineales bacterium]
MEEIRPERCDGEGAPQNEFLVCMTICFTNDLVVVDLSLAGYYLPVRL